MPTIQEIEHRDRVFKAQQQANAKKAYYEGPIKYRGELINWKHSIKRVVKTLRRSLIRSQFASLNVVGIPGSGKTVCVGNIITDLIEEEEKDTGEHYNVFWKGAEDLRNLGEVIDNLPKGTNNILVFDDVSKALDRLSSSEQSEVFEQLTTTRHTTGGRLLIISLYHYTFANLKSVKSQSIVVVYTSVTLTELGNISQMLGSKQSLRSLTKFAKIYESAFMKGEFELSISKTQKRLFFDSKPFRPCFVVNLFRVHIALFMRLDNGYQAPAQIKEKINTDLLIGQTRKSYDSDGELALRIHCMLKGQAYAMRGDVYSAFKMVQELNKNHIIDWSEVAEKVKPPGAKRTYRKRKTERDASHLIIKESREVPVNPEPVIKDMSLPEQKYQEESEPDDFEEEDEFAEFHNINKEGNEI